MDRAQFNDLLHICVDDAFDEYGEDSSLPLEWLHSLRDMADQNQNTYPIDNLEALNTESCISVLERVMERCQSEYVMLLTEIASIINEEILKEL